MDLSPQQIEQIKEYGKALTPIGDVALLMGLDEEEIRSEIQNKKTEAGKAYGYGRAQTEYDIRVTEINLAANGSPMAIQNVKDYVERLVYSDDI